MHTDQWLATGLQRGAFNHALLWSFHLANPIGVVNQATTPKPRLGAPKPRPGDHKTYM